MLKKKKVKTMYITQIVCGKCGGKMQHTHTLYSYPAQYCYECEKCSISTISTTRSGIIEYEFEEDTEDV